MVSHKMVAAQISPNRDASADSEGHQGPMPLQNTCSVGGYDPHPQKLLQLVGCRDLSLQFQNPKNAFSWRREKLS
jgi:hypothetical protein